MTEPVTPLLEVDDLSIAFDNGKTAATVVERVYFYNGG
jgi:hypothetical protein